MVQQQQHNNDDEEIDQTTTTPTARNLSSSSSEPRFKIGVIADIQYAPIPDGFSFGGKPRYYRNSLKVAANAAKHFETEKACEVVLNLGDIIDGKCQAIEANGGDPNYYYSKNAISNDADDDSNVANNNNNNNNNNNGDDDDDEGYNEGVADPGIGAIDDVLEALSSYKRGPILHTYGNHELYNLGRDVIGKKLNIPFVREPCGDLAGYWTHQHRGFRFIIIDSYDIAKMGRCDVTSQKYKQANNILSRENPNYPHNENSADGLQDDSKRFVAFNGGVGKIQLEWLQDTLASARESQEKVIVVSHQPILPGSSNSVCLMWNFEDVLTILRDYNDVVVASFSGHAHSGGYKRDEQSGIHFRSFEAALETPHPRNTYGMVEVHDDCLVVQGHGDCASAVYSFDHIVYSDGKSCSAPTTPTTISSSYSSS